MNVPRKAIFRILQVSCVVLIIIGLISILIFSSDNNPTNITDSSFFSFKINTSINTESILEVNPNETALYLNYFDTYPCPYYSDRADLIAPEINRLAQMMRAFGMKIIFHTLTEKPSEITANIQTPETELNLEKTSPNLQDKCLYTDFDKTPAPSNGSIHHDIMFSSKSDYFVKDHNDGVKLAHQLGIKYLIVGGMRCNYWLLPFFRNLKLNNIQPIYIYDLSDVAYFREAQVKQLDTHTKALIHFWTIIAVSYTHLTLPTM